MHLDAGSASDRVTACALTRPSWLLPCDRLAIMGRGANATHRPLLFGQLISSASDDSAVRSGGDHAAPVSSRQPHVTLGYRAYEKLGVVQLLEWAMPVPVPLAKLGIIRVTFCADGRPSGMAAFMR